MSRTREIEVYIYKERMDDPWFNCHQTDSKNINKKEMIRGRLIVDLPERKVTISEREFYEKTCDFFRVLSGPNSDIQIAKKWQEMFFKDAK